MVHCLTDLFDFHYFVIKEKLKGKIEIMMYLYIKSDITEDDDLKKHFAAVLNLIQQYCM